jgi:hypothetical protein
VRRMTRWATILTHNRPVELRRTVEQIAPQADAVLVVDNASDPPVARDGWPDKVRIVRDELQPPNLATLWRRALDVIADAEQTIVEPLANGGHTWDVAMLCDDLTIPADWFERVASMMRGLGAAAASTHQAQAVAAPILKKLPDADLWNRMCGSAFVTAGEKRLRPDETMHWWWFDTTFDWEARLAGGMVIVPGPIATNDQPNHWTNAKPELGEQAGRDGAAFQARWGWKPW